MTFAQDEAFAQNLTQNPTQISRSLAEWYAKDHRDLPWRRTTDAYKIVVSEIMLQQTVARVVIPYYERFLRAFPHFKALAEAPERQVVSLWSGLGYYSRARNLQAMAQAIVRRGGNGNDNVSDSANANGDACANASVPTTYEEWLTLPGIGPYTAAAVASFAFGKKVAAVDGNVTRVMTRLLDLSDPVDKASTKRTLQSSAQALIDASDDGATHNQAMIELGATLCTSQNPSCLVCPIRLACKSRQNNTQDARPVKSKKTKAFTHWLWDLDLFETDKGSVLLVKGDNGSPWLSHLWVLPGNAKQLSAPPSRAQFHFKHSITTHHIYVRVRHHVGSGLRSNQLTSTQSVEIAWVSKQEIDQFGVSSVVLKALSRPWSQA